jgi:hypothetical protein
MDDAPRLDAFSDTYAAARERFLALTAKHGAQLTSLVHPDERGAEGEDLAIDIAVFGEPEAEKTLLLISGTHGQEGFTGSALQIAFLGALDVPPGVNVVALHALNPWGFSHRSRTDERNIDLNRNFGDFPPPAPANDGLAAALHLVLCPDDWTDETRDWSEAQKRLIEAHGVQRFVDAATGGQFEEPTGLNYGGRGPSWSRRAVTPVLPQVLANARKIAFIDWHTGIGRYGELCHVSMDAPGSPTYERVFGWMGEEARGTFAAAMDISDGVTASYSGPFGVWLPVTAPQAEWAGLGIEIGTYDNQTMANALRMDRWLKFGHGRSTQSRDEIRATMMELLCPSDLAWRRSALANGCDAQRRTFEGLQRW